LIIPRSRCCDSARTCSLCATWGHRIATILQKLRGLAATLHLHLSTHEHVDQVLPTGVISWVTRLGGTSPHVAGSSAPAAARTTMHAVPPGLGAFVAAASEDVATKNVCTHKEELLCQHFNVAFVCCSTGSCRLSCFKLQRSPYAHVAPNQPQLAVSLQARC
jgi:hypothetical protein